ncbi:DUF4329 domain-containing protein [Roseovarius faecimaris]|nr:DUF4329 domain-containing protein [Roseovarius faecimaris]
MIRQLTALAILAALGACGDVEVSSAPIEGPRTKDADAFAIAYLDLMQARSFRRGVEYCGLFGRDAEGYVIATAPLVGRLSSCHTPDFPDGFNAFATYHSHSTYDIEADSEVPSSNDVIADQIDGVIGYISTPGGRVWRNEDGVATLVCGPGCITADPNFVPETFGPIRTRYTIIDLREREAS